MQGVFLIGTTCPLSGPFTQCIFDPIMTQKGCQIFFCNWNTLACVSILWSLGREKNQSVMQELRPYSLFKQETMLWIETPKSIHAQQNLWKFLGISVSVYVTLPKMVTQQHALLKKKHVKARWRLKVEGKRLGWWTKKKYVTPRNESLSWRLYLT